MVYYFLLGLLLVLSWAGVVGDQELLWSGGNGKPTWAKVAWPMIILTISQGRLAIVDLVCQSRALLGKEWATFRWGASHKIQTH